LDGVVEICKSKVVSGVVERLPLLETVGMRSMKKRSVRDECLQGQDRRRSVVPMNRVLMTVKAQRKCQEATIEV